MCWERKSQGTHWEIFDASIARLNPFQGYGSQIKNGWEGETHQELGQAKKYVSNLIKKWEAELILQQLRVKPCERYLYEAELEEAELEEAEEG